MKLHIGIFFYAQAPYVDTAFSSLASLTGKRPSSLDVRVSVFDDASPDSTPDRIREAAGRLSIPVELHLATENKGGKARMSEFVSSLEEDEVAYIIAGDDFIAPDGMLAACRYLDEHNLDMLVCNSFVARGNQVSHSHRPGWPYSLINRSPQAFARFLSTYYPRPLLLQSSLFRAAFLKHLFRHAWRSRLDDWPVFIRAFSNGGSFEFRHDLNISTYVLHEDSLSSSQERLLSLVEEVAQEFGFMRLWGPLSIVSFRRALTSAKAMGIRGRDLSGLLNLRSIAGLLMEVAYKWRSLLPS